MKPEETVVIWDAWTFDGSLQRMTLSDAYDWAVGYIDESLSGPEYLFEHDRQCRRFALNHLAFIDRAKFLHFANVSAREPDGLAELSEALYRERVPLYSGTPQEKALWHAEVMAAWERVHADHVEVPRANALLLDGDILVPPIGHQDVLQFHSA